MTNTPVQRHQKQAPDTITCATVTISDSRTAKTDRGGPRIVELLQQAGHTVDSQHIVADEPAEIQKLIHQLVDNSAVQAVLTTGGTGISVRDQTYEVVCDMLDRPLPGYGELLRMLSYQEIGPAAMLSRATGGVIGKTIILTMPGSPAAVDLAMNRLILPELQHIWSIKPLDNRAWLLLSFGAFRNSPHPRQFEAV